MPVFLVRVNNYTRHGSVRYQPELMGITASLSTRADAIDWTLQDAFGLRLRDVEVDVLSDRDDCWFQRGPEEYQ